MTQLSSPQVLCRPAVESDRADVFEFCKGIWEGEDYVPYVWDDWSRDPDGVLAIAEYDGHAIGCSKVTRIATGQWWLEGFRVDPKHQGLKVGTHLHQYVTNWWLEHGEGTIRLMTDAGNLAVHHLCDKTGYTKVNEVCGYRALPLDEPAVNFTPATDMELAAGFAMESESIQTTGGLIDLGWRICTPSPEVFQVYSGRNADYAHSFYWWQERQGLFSAWEDEEEGRRTLFLGAVATTLINMPDLLTDIRRFAADKQFDFVFQIAFDMPQVVSPLLEAGFEKRWKRSNAFVFERTHPRTQKAVGGKQ
ncbi:MAG: GNAT family N-acetyltransferase [Bacteroidota bacterium]